MGQKNRAVSTPAMRALREAGVEFSVHQFRHDDSASSYGQEAATQLGLAPQVVYKTLLALVDSQLVVAVISVADQLDLKALARAAGAKGATMAPVEQAERVTGYVRGGISPLGQRQRLPTYLDESASQFNKIYVSGGRRGIDVGVAPTDLVNLTDATVVPLRRSSGS